jgi:Ca2+/Na+ antiporter
MALTIFTAYAILKHHLFEIRVILTEILVGVMGLILSCVPFLMADKNLKILMSLVFLFYCLIGYLLIKSTLKEVNAKETLEQKVQERTRELQKSKDDLEQSKKVAEERARELEKWYNLTIGRELRMAELKEKIKEIETKKS